MAKQIPTTIKELSQKYRAQHLDPNGVTNRCLQNVTKLKELNIFSAISSEIALTHAKESHERYQKNGSIGGLDGVPIAVKDNFCVKGVPTTCASKMLQNFVPTYNATVYERLQQQGAVLIGKTNLDEFGMGSGTIDSSHGPTKNIWNREKWHIAGGSSGGSAVAVASGICFGALGSDTGGSTRNPASYCGVVGLKPSYGLVSRHGLIPLVNSMDVPGIITRTIDDCATILNAIAGPDPKDSTTLTSPFNKITFPKELNIKNITIGIPKEYHCDGLSNEVLETWIKVADMLEDCGAQVEEISLPNTASSIFVYTILNQCEVASNMARYDGIQYGHRSNEDYSTEQLYAKTREEGFNNVVKNRILSGNYYLLRKNYDKFFQKALKVRRLILNDFENVFSGSGKVDLILTPTTLTEAPLYRDFIQSNNRDQCAVQDFCTQPANMAGIPAISIPIRLSSNQMPISLQLMGPYLSEQTLLTVAKWIEQHVNFPHLTEHQ